MPVYQPGQVVNGYVFKGGNQKDKASWQPTSGDTFLNSLPLDDNKKAVIKGIANYELPPGSQRGGLGSPEIQQLLGFAKQYDPTFSAQDYSVRQGIKSDFTKGQYSKTITALNTAIDHARGLAENGAALGNTDYPIVNAVKNGFDQYVMGDPRQGNYKQNAELLAGEVIKAATGAQGGEMERVNQTGNYAVNGSPAQQNGAIGQTVSLLKGKLDELNATYKRAFNHGDVMDLLSPSARKSWQVLNNQYGAAGHSGDGGATPANGGGQPSVSNW